MTRDEEIAALRARVAELEGALAEAKAVAVYVEEERAALQSRLEAMTERSPEPRGTPLVLALFRRRGAQPS